MNVGFLDRKVKSKINKTLLIVVFSPTRSLDEQDKMVKFCITQVRYAGHKVQNQKNKDTFGRSIEKKLYKWNIIS